MRHGDVSYFDAQGQPVTDSDKVVLNEKGRAEADATGAYLKGIGLQNFDRVISSTLPRTIETAERVMRVLGPAGEPTEVEALREKGIGSSADIRNTPTSELPQVILILLSRKIALAVRRFSLAATREGFGSSEDSNLRGGRCESSR
jgi:broad specificity phosphatase PhoE